jgi:hypothetical protein
MPDAAPSALFIPSWLESPPLPATRGASWANNSRPKVSIYRPLKHRLATTMGLAKVKLASPIPAGQD